MLYPQIPWKIAFACWVLTLSSSFLAAQEAGGIKWREDYTAARREAEARNLPILIDFVKIACPPCERMDQITFRDPKIVATLNERYIPLRIVGSVRPQLTADLGVTAFPTLILATPDGRIAQTHVGFQESDFLADKLLQVIASVKPAEAVQRDYQNAVKWEATGDYPRALTALRNILDEGKSGTLQQSAQDLLTKIEKQAEERLLNAKALEEKGQYTDALEALTELMRVYPGVPASKDASDWIARISQANEGAKASQRAKRARELLAQAHDFYKSKDYIPCIDRCEIIIANYGDLPEGAQAFRLAAEIKNNPDWLQNAADVMTDRLGGMWLALADAHLKRGNVLTAQNFLQRVVQAFPGSRMAESAQIRLTQLRGTAPTKGIESARP
jgi:TolA-binding protein